MTASLRPESTSSSRRALLAGALGGLGALAASAIGRPQVARADDPNDVLLGGPNSTNTTTSIANNADNSIAVFEASGISGKGVYGHCTTGVGVDGHSDSSVGVDGSSNSNFGVYGSSTSGHAVQGSSSLGSGVRGFSSATDQPGTLGRSNGNSTGVLGSSGPGTPPPVQPKTGVYGYAAQDDTAIGVRGESIDGIGVLGLATAGSGIAAFGLFARSNSTNAAAIGARSAGNATAVLAKSGTGSFPSAKAKTAVYGYAAQDSGAKGVWGETTSGHALHGTATSGFAGYFAGKVYTSQFVEMTEISAPAAPAANKARLFLRDSGGKTQLCIRFQSGGVQVIKSEP